MWPPSIFLCLTALTLQSLAASLSSEGSVTLFLLLENLDWPFAGVSGVMAAVSVVVALFALFVAPWVEQVSSAWLPVAVSVITGVLRLGLALLVSFLPTHELRQGWAGGMLTLILLLLHMLEQCFMGQWLMLAIDRSVHLIPDLPKEEWTATRNLIWGVNYALGNGTIAVALGLYDYLRTSIALNETANALTLWMAVGAHALTLLVLIGMALFFWTPLTTHSAELLRRKQNKQQTPFHVTPHPGSSEETKQVLWRDPYFIRFVVFSLVIQGVLSLFRHMDQTVPLVLQRLYTPKVHFAWVQAINPLFITFLAPLLQWRTSHRPGYWVIVVGSAISSSATLLLLFGPTDGGHHQEAQWWDYLPFICFMIVFSVGEALWSARLTPYMLQVAPEDQKATYLAVARLPALLSRLFLVWEAAALLQTYCPAAGSCYPRGLWFWAWIGSAVTPFCLTVFFRLVRPERYSSLSKELAPFSSR